MTPYGSLTWALLALSLALPAIVLGVRGRLDLRWAFIATLVMLVAQFAPERVDLPRGSVNALLVVAGWVVLACGTLLLFRRARPKGAPAGETAIVCGVLLAPLVVFKVTAAVAPGSEAGFLGLSYVTFRALDVALTIGDGVAVPATVPELFTYLLFFPTLSAGPIDRYLRFHEDARRRPTRCEYTALVDGAVYRIHIGLLYKYVLGSLVDTFWLTPLDHRTGLAATVGYMYAYSFFLFFDFAGYSQLAIGLGQLFGIRTPDNFNRPFLAVNMIDFWNRWHITLSGWLRDNVYTRLVLAGRIRGWFSSPATASAAGLLVTFGAMGAWHGLAPRYLAYGFYHAVLLVIQTLLNDRRRRAKRPPPTRRQRVAGQILTFHLACFGFLIFSGRLG